MSRSMIPITPDITIEELRPQHASQLAELLNSATSILDHCTMFDHETVVEGVFNDESFHRKCDGHITDRQCIGAWQAGRLIGFVDTAVTSAFSNGQPVAQQPVSVLPQQRGANSYHGLIRTLILPKSAALASEVKALLLNLVESRWREGGIQSIFAFLPHGGYRQIQAGIGVLPAQWREHFRLLTESGYQLSQRYRAMKRPLDRFVEEIHPELPTSVETHDTPTGWNCELYYRRVNQIGRISLSGITPEAGQNQSQSRLDTIDPATSVAVVNELYINDEWRNQNLGKFLLRKAINDAQHRGYKALLIYLQQESHRGWSLLAQQGFQELEYRGYSFEKSLNGS